MLLLYVIANTLAENFNKGEKEMLRESFLDRVRLFNLERVAFILKFPTRQNEEELNEIKDAMKEGGQQRAMIVYLNAMINGDKKIFNIVKNVCEENLYAKLIAAGLNKV